ncbi:hypothetical protein, partial [Escherichia coli]|uniref:hypothetical protein n=1 Tax=Escherichia coli TaxID=562 RepID=UPI003C2B2B62
TKSQPGKAGLAQKEPSHKRCCLLDHAGEHRNNIHPDNRNSLAPLSFGTHTLTGFNRCRQTAFFCATKHKEQLQGT